MPDQVETDIRERLAFLGIGAAEKALISRIGQQVRQSLGPALDRFYRRVGETPSLARFFSNPGQQKSARTQQEKHWSRILKGDFGPDYVQSTKAIGNTHARIGLEPQWYIGSYGLLLEGIVSGFLREAWPQPPQGFFRRLFRKAKPVLPVEEATRRVGLLIKAALLDMELGLQTYTLNMDDQERSRAEKERTESLTALSEALADALERMAKGDLVQEIDPDLETETTRMSGAFQNACAGLSHIVHAVRSTSGVVEHRARTLSSSSEDVACRIAEQVQALGTVSRNITELTTSVKEVAEEARQADETVEACCHETGQGTEIVNRTVEAMAKISESSTQIVQIISVIDEIAFQTNLLALNAGVEAARAGDAGRGFAVVAQEIRALAQRSTTAAREIKELISSSMEDVERGVKMVDETGAALGNITTSVNRLGEAVGEIASGAEEQALRIMEINASTTQLEAVTKTNAAIVQEMSGSSQELVGDAAELMKIVMNFKVRNDQSALSQSRTGLTF